MKYEYFTKKCEGCGKDMQAQSQTKKKCFDCKNTLKKKRAYEYSKTQKRYKCLTCDDKGYNEVYSPNEQCGFCKKYAKKNTIQKTNN